MKQSSKVEVNLHTPKVAYKETITGKGEGHYKHKKQSGGRGQYGEVYLRVEPTDASDEEWFVNAIVGGAIPGNFVPAVQKGLVEGMQRGAVAGYPVENVKVTRLRRLLPRRGLLRNRLQDRRRAGAARRLSKAKPVLLEPIMKVTVTIPDQFMGDVTGDLNHKRGRILGMDTEDGLQVITAEVPQAEMFQYSSQLRSMTGGRGLLRDGVLAARAGAGERRAEDRRGGAEARTRRTRNSLQRAAADGWGRGPERAEGSL